MMKLKENVSLLIDRMKKISYLLIFLLLGSCTSNTILEEPKDLIPRDTMSLLIQEMFVASSSKFFKNKNLQKNINYMPLVYNRFKIDSTRFQVSNLYYMSKIDLYQEIFKDAKLSLEAKKKYFDDLKTRLDSLEKDSIKQIRVKKRAKITADSLKKTIKSKI